MIPYRWPPGGPRVQEGESTMAVPRPVAPRSSEVAPDGEVLQAQLRFLQTIVEHSIEMFVVVDEDGVIRYANTCVERTLGHPIAELLGSGLRGYMHDEDAPAVEPWLSGAVGEEPVEFRIRQSDGLWRTVTANGAPLPPGSLVPGTIVTLRDATDQKLARELQQ